jgi:transcription-repair coupling factor (superfamily II helicase)
MPDWEVLPYDQFSPLPDLVSDRLAALAQLPSMRRGVLLVSIDALLQRLPPCDYIQARSFDVATGQTFSLETVRAQLASAGYVAVSQVTAPGEYALRGSLFDVYPMGYSQPLRIDLLDDQIESIRHFDPETQRSLERREKLKLLPAREFPLDDESCKQFRRRFRIRFDGDPTRSSIYKGVKEGVAPPGIEFYLPLFFENTATLFDYLPREHVLLTDDHVGAQIQRLWLDITARHEDRRHDRTHPILDPAELFLDPAAVVARLTASQRVQLSTLAPTTDDRGNLGAAAEIRLDARAAQPLAPLQEHLELSTGRTLLVADSPGRREVMQDLLRGAGIRFEAVGGWPEFLAATTKVALTVAPDIGGLQVYSPALTLLSDGELFGRRAQQERRQRRSSLDPHAILRDLQDLVAGAPVVHVNYGVGRYIGLQMMHVADQEGEFLIIEYQGGDRIYVPVAALHLVGRYTGAVPESAPLHKLGTDQWARARKRASEQVRDVAAELLDLYAQRQARQGTSLQAPEQDYRAFAAAFPFEETADQADAINSVIKDLAQLRPMDRVVCGDVGFGKTEVAMRAAFVAVQSGRQVAVLVPTTLLAEQHLANFRDRFADLPVRVESLSRFRGGKESRAILDGIADGRVDILIATHRLLHADAKFKDLALLIIDEEHRFGVRDKEKLKALRAEIHVLTLTATPIPRTLNMALGGLRELSLITTPPPGRVAIKTFVSEWQAPLIREAALRELRRGGQIYFVHNEIQTIEKMADDLRKLIPEAKLRIGHGQMRERDLEELMVDFYHRRFDLLLCTTIIESGIDVPTANTIMINLADRLGLAQLHQLRGRVGRSHHRAYAYLLVPSRKGLTQDAARRLEALESLEELGAGFVLATHDLEIRGAGEFLGESQSGELSEVGLSLYLEMLETTVRAMKEGRDPALERPLAANAEVNLHIACLLPDAYIGDVQMRLGLYKRIASAATAADLELIQTELGDRFGALPQPATNLVHGAHLILRCRNLGIHRLDVGAQSSYIVFNAQNQVDPAQVIRLIQNEPRVFRLEGSLKLRIARGAAEPDRRQLANAILDQLTRSATAGAK